MEQTFDATIFAKNPDRLLVEIGFAGAQYGLYMPVMAIATHLGVAEKTRCASILMLGVLNLSLKNYAGARTIFRAVVENPAYSTYHQEASALLAVVNNISPIGK